jgi:hypothetical protein
MQQCAFCTLFFFGAMWTGCSNRMGLGAATAWDWVQQPHGTGCSNRMGLGAATAWDWVQQPHGTGYNSCLDDLGDS